MMNEQLIIGLVIGWTLGASVMWLYFSVAGLIRNRDEWENNRKARMRQMENQQIDDIERKIKSDQ